MFIENIGQYEFKNQFEIEKASKQLWRVFHKLRPIVNKCEYEDLKQDIILIVIEADNDFDPRMETKFLTFLTWRLMQLNDNIISRYTGVKLHKEEKSRLEKQTGEKIYINITNLEEEV